MSFMSATAAIVAFLHRHLEHHAFDGRLDQVRHLARATDGALFDQLQVVAGRGDLLLREVVFEIGSGKVPLVDELPIHQLLDARVLGLGVGEADARSAKACFSGVEIDYVGDDLDLGDQVARLHVLSRRYVELFDDSRDARLDGDFAPRNDGAGGDRLFDDVACLCALRREDDGFLARLVVQEVQRPRE
jgi:hypothetical protein